MTRLKSNLIGKWTEPSAPTPDELDGAEALDRHRSLICGKPLLLSLYRRWYRFYGKALDSTAELGDLPVVELGSGAGIVDLFFPEVRKTDVVAHPLVQEVVRAEAMPYGDGSLRALLMIDVLHHLTDPRAFFREAERCLAPGGRVLMIEPMNSPWGRFIWGNFHLSERFDPGQKEWESEPTGRLSEANMALPWIIFFRDREKFRREFPNLQIASLTPHTALGYFITGGLSYRPFVPSWLGRGIQAIEPWFIRILPGLASMVTIELSRAGAPRAVVPSPIEKTG